MTVKERTRQAKPDYHVWTEEEREIVRREYDGTNASRDAIAVKLGVSPMGVRGQVARLGLGKKLDRRPWTPEEDAKLETLLERYAPLTAARRLRRSVDAVCCRAKRLRISRQYRLGWYTKRDVCEILGVDHRWVQRRIDDGRLPATSHYGTEVGQKGMNAWHIMEKDLKAYIRRYPEELTGRNVDLVAIVNILVGVDYPNPYDD